MYDLYSIPDGVETPMSPSEDRYIGSLSLEEHVSLRVLWAHLKDCGVSIDYFSDARISAHQVTVVRQAIRKAMPGFEQRIGGIGDQVARKLDEFLQIAESQGFGIVGFAD